MNVCFIGKHKYPKDIFSNEQDMKTWRGMASYFDNLFVIASSPDLFFHNAKEKNISVYLIPNIFGYAGFIIGAVKIGFYLNWRYGVDAFDSSEIAGGGIAATILKLLTNKPTVIEIQGEVFKKIDSYENLKSRLLKKIGRFTIRQAARVRVISNAIFNQVKEQGINENKIRIVSLRVDLNLFNPLSTSNVDNFAATQLRGEPRPEKSGRGDKVGITLGYLGRLVGGKGLEDLFEAIAILKSQNLKFNCLIYGTGPLGKKLKKTAKNLLIADLVEWRGFASYNMVPEALSKIDIFVYPSWHEGFGRSIMEALAMEKAVVATKVGGIPDLIKNEENGLLVEPHNPGELASKIKKLMHDENLREKFGKAGRKWVSENFEWNSGIKKFADLFLELKK